ncbi:MAG: 2-keto-4-pentenoate hydratase [Propionibacterium sp.]|nr:2-keto-4-pentenoate hydratase [Propionibacterium sp.]
MIPHQELADALLTAYRTGEPVEPFTPRFPGATIEDAYRVQQLQVAAWLDDGDRIVGHKVGLASRAMQDMMGVNQPDFVHLTQRMFHLEHAPIPVGTFQQPRVEPEVAFILGRPLTGPGVSIADAIAAVDHVVPALEFVDSRISNWQIRIFDTVADNASSGGVVLGSRPTKLADVDLRLMGCNLFINGELRGTGAGGAVLGSPLNALVWLANTLGPMGVTLEPGHVVLPGSMTRAFDVAPGDSIVAHLAGLGSVTTYLAKEDQ